MVRSGGRPVWEGLVFEEDAASGGAVGAPFTLEDFVPGVMIGGELVLGGIREDDGVVGGIVLWPDMPLVDEVAAGG